MLPSSDCTLLFQESIPFAVIGSNTVVEAKGRRVRGRLYPWGIVEGNHLPWNRSGPWAVLRNCCIYCFSPTACAQRYWGMR